MVGYLPIADEEVQPGAPLLSSLGVRLRDNPTAIAEAQDGAPNTLTKNIRLFTSSGTWNKPDRLRFVEVWVVGGGGGGRATGGPDGQNVATPGGGGGASFKAIARGDLGSSEVVTVGSGGSGGSGGTASTAPGQNGGASSFGSHLSATGGVGGATDEPGNGGTGSGGDVNLRGGYGSGSGSSSIGGNGAGPLGGPQNIRQNNAVSAQSYGVGGRHPVGFGNAGGNGSAGVVVVIEYLGGEVES